MKPLHDNVIVKRLDAESVTKGGIILAEKARGKSIRGTVVAVGPGKRLENGTILDTGIKVGDTVIYDSEYAGQEFYTDGQELLALRADEVLAVEEP